MDILKAWANSPFRMDMDAKGWFVFVGFVVLLLIIWKLILAHLFEAIT